MGSQGRCGVAMSHSLRHLESPARCSPRAEVSQCHSGTKKVHRGIPGKAALIFRRKYSPSR